MPTLRGIAGQTFGDFEAVIIDDGSTDGTAARVRSALLEMDDPRFVYRQNAANIGLTRSLIGAIAGSSSPYVAIHDAGDISLPDRLRRQVEALDADPAIGAVGCHYVDVLPERNLYVVRRPDASTASFRSLLRRPVFAHGEVTFRRAAYDAVGGYRPEFRYAQDSDLWLRMIRLGRLSTVPQVLYHRTLYPSGISYEPRTVIDQAAFYALGRIVAEDPITGQAALSRLRSGVPIGDVLPRSASRIQALILRKTLRHLVFGDTALASTTAGAYTRSQLVKALLSAACHLSAQGYGGSLLGLIQVGLGLRSGSPPTSLDAPGARRVSPNGNTFT